MDCGTPDWPRGRRKDPSICGCPFRTANTSASFAAKLLDEAAVVVAPGNGYGEYGEGYVRFSLTLADDRLEEGIERIRKVL